MLGSRLCGVVGYTKDAGKKQIKMALYRRSLQFMESRVMSARLALWVVGPGWSIGYGLTNDFLIELGDDTFCLLFAYQIF